METPVEFSSFYKLLNAIKEGSDEKKEILEIELNKYKEGEDAPSYLHELGQLFLFIGVNEIYKYTNQKDLKVIGNLSKEEWSNLSENQESELPQYLAKQMIRFTKDNNIAKKISQKWGKSPREINKHTIKMSRYITEGLIDMLE